MKITPPEIIDLGRIRLRRPVVGDVEGMFECGSDPMVALYADWPLATSIGPMIARFEKHAERWDAGEDFRWSITLAGEDRAIGAISCCAHGHTAEVGFLIQQRHWGNGFATEAAKAVVNWAISEPAVWRVWATCDVDNTASTRVLEKAGLTREGILRRAVIRPNLSEEPRDACMYSLVK